MNRPTVARQVSFDDMLRAGAREALRRPPYRVTGGTHRAWDAPTSTAGQVRIRSVRRQAYAYSSTHRLESVDLVLDDGTVLEMLAKTQRNGQGPGSDLRDADRELAIYRDYLEGRETGAPALYASMRSDAGTTLLLERIHGVELYQVGDAEVWFATARWLGRFHATFASATRLRTSAPGDLLVRDRAWWATRWARAIAALEESCPRKADQLRTLAEPFQLAAARLETAPATLIHGEFYPANVMVEGDADELRIRPVDWEMAGRGSGLLDLAALSAGRWDAATRQSIVAAYRDSIDGTFASPGSQREFDQAFRDARLLLAVQWLGWAPDWNPPVEHANDWMAEAFGAVHGPV